MAPDYRRLRLRARSRPFGPACIIRAHKEHRYEGRRHARARGPEVLRYEDVPDPLAAPGEALVRVRACALNHLDIWTRIGQAGRMVTFPHILGNDIAGEVVSLRTPVEGIAPGSA
jgi:NADPH:quinone reductase-like Zn-dependent oxidoreductase